MPKPQTADMTETDTETDRVVPADSESVPTTNGLIDGLPARARAQFLALCESHRLVLGEVVSEAGKLTRHVYFPTSGFISLVATLDGKPVIEVGMVGREGMLGAHVALGAKSTPVHALVQGHGMALRISVSAFRSELARSPALQRRIDLYLSVMLAQFAGSAACLRFHQIGPRLARWLLMSQDRAHSSRFHVTHEFLAYMLGVRRVGITLAAKAMHDSRLIEYHRGALHVLDRPGLEAASCGCYAAGELIYSDQMG